MSKSAMICVGIVGLLHAAILYFEMFNWGFLAPRLLPENLTTGETGVQFIKDTAVMAQNQGLYNGFLAAGLFWSLLISTPEWKRHVATFFLLCVAVAGVYGFITLDKLSILIAQTGTSLIALAVLHLRKPSL